MLIAGLLGPPQINQPWKDVAPGVQQASAADLGGDAGWAARVVLIDPAKARFLVRYDPDRPTLAEWRKRYPRAVAISNGSFYSVDGPPGAEVRPTCDLIADGKPVRGAGCKRQDALFFGAQPKAIVPASALVSREPLKAQVRLLSPAEFRVDDWSEALKSFPALVHAGAAACAGPHYCAESSRTAAVAQMKDGRILLFASQWPAVRREVGKWLAEQMGAVEALNLDGGPEATLSV
ncbi:MAG: phosphodiester glycosidase family protein, partial [Myxococcales bacterium]